MLGRRRLWFYAAAVVLATPLMLWRDFTLDNELRYLSIADEALRNGSVFAFSNHGEPYADKPPLYIWLLMACAGSRAAGTAGSWDCSRLCLRS